MHNVSDLTFIYLTSDSTISLETFTVQSCITVLVTIPMLYITAPRFILELQSFQCKGAALLSLQSSENGLRKCV